MVGRDGGGVKQGRDEELSDYRFLPVQSDITWPAG